MKLKNRIIKKGDFFILFLVLILAGGMFVVISNQAKGNNVLITVDGKSKKYPLNNNQKIKVKKDDAKYNTIIIDNGEVYMENASCPDQVCVRHKKISRNGEMIICLPNEVFIEVESDNDSEIDN